MAMNNPYANIANSPVARELQHQQQEGLNFLNAFKAGHVNPASFNADQIGQIISTLGEPALNDPQLASALEPYIQLGESANAPLNLKYAALAYRANQAANQGQFAPQVQQFLGQSATSAPMLQEQGNLFNALAPELYNNQAFDQAFGNFLNQHAPGGNVPLDVNTLGAIAPTYNYLQTYAPDVASQFGQVAFPTDTTNTSNELRNAIIDAAKGALGAQGFNYVTPTGPARFTPAQLFEQGLKGLGSVIQQGYNGAANFFNGPFTPAPTNSSPAPAASTQAPSPASAVKSAKNALGTGGKPPAPTSGTQSNLAQVEAYLQQNGVPQGALLSALSSNLYGPQFAQLLGNQGVNELAQWAQTALPGGSQLPTGTIDPFRALFTAAAQ